MHHFGQLREQRHRCLPNASNWHVWHAPWYGRCWFMWPSAFVGDRIALSHLPLWAYIYIGVSEFKPCMGVEMARAMWHLWEEQDCFWWQLYSRLQVLAQKWSRPMGRLASSKSVVVTMVEYSRCYRWRVPSCSCWRPMKENIWFIFLPGSRKNLFTVDDHDILWVWIVAEPVRMNTRYKESYSMFGFPLSHLQL